MSSTIIYLATQQARETEAKAEPQPVKTLRLDSLRGVTFGSSSFVAAISYLKLVGTFWYASSENGLLHTTYRDVEITGPEAAVDALLKAASNV